MTHRGYIGQLAEVRPVLAGMERRGMPIDDQERLKLGAAFDVAAAELGRELASLAKGCGLVDQFVGLNPELRRWFIDRGTEPKLWREDPEGISLLLAAELQDADGLRYHYEEREVQVAAEGADGEPALMLARRWCRIYDFNANSKDQVILYMKSKGHKVPKDKHREDADGENPETTAAKELLRLASSTGDVFYIKVVEYRGLSKLKGTYVDGFAPAPATGCVHTTFAFDTGIGQLNSRNPNVQNFPKLKPTPALAKSMRKMVAAKPGHVITEWDFKSCHVITLGFLAEDLNYMRLGRLDIHSFVAGHFLNLWDGFKIFSETDQQLRDRFHWLKSDPERKRVRDDQAKHGILGIGNGLKARGLFERYMESFPPRACPACQGRGRELGARPGTTRACSQCRGLKFQSGQRIAELVLETCEQLFAKVFAYQAAEAQRAHTARELRSEFGHIRRFYEVFRPAKGEWAPGDQHEQALAFRLANIAFGHIREKLKELAQAGLDRKYGLFNTVHDSFMFTFPETLLDEHIREVYPVLVAPSKVLRHPTIAPQGLVIDVEGSWGHNWAEMNEIDLAGFRSQQQAAETQLKEAVV